MSVENILVAHRDLSTGKKKKRQNYSQAIYPLKLRRSHSLT